MTVFITGDIHSDTLSFNQRMQSIKSELSERDIVICCGDVGLYYGRRVYGSLKKAMAKYPCTFLIMRGNHDSKVWDLKTKTVKEWLAPQEGWDFSDKFFEITLYQKKYPNIHYIDDAGGIYDIDGHCCAFYPGAYSVDRGYRLAYGLPYEMEEQLTDLEFERLNKLTMENKNDIEFVFSHTCPMSAEPLVRYLFLNGLDQSKIDKTTEKWLDIYYKHLLDGKNFKHWFFGHFHDDKELDDTFTIVNNKVIRLENYGK